MRRSLSNWLWILGVAFAAAGLLRSTFVLETPPAAILPEPLRSRKLKLADFRVLPLPGAAAEQGRDVSWSQRARYWLVPDKGPSMQLELVVRRSRTWTGLVLPALTRPRSLRLASNQQIQLGEESGERALRTCIVGRGAKAMEPEAHVNAKALNDAVLRWRNRLDPADLPVEAFWRMVAIQAGFRVSERWECLMVTLRQSGSGASPAQRGNPANDQQLIQAWHDLFTQLKPWGENWDGVKY